MTSPVFLRRVRASVLRDFRPLSPLDRLTLVYVAFTTLVVIAHVWGWRHEPLPWQLAGMLLLANGLLLVAATAAHRARRDGARGFIAEWYVPIVLVGLYAIIGLLNEPAGGGAHSFDTMVQGWDAALFGGQVAFDWPRSMPNYLFAEFLSLCYLSFYAVCIGSPAVLWAIGRKAEARQAIFAELMTFFGCYAVFLLFPVAGPPYFWPWPEGPAFSGPLVGAVQHLISSGDSWGSAFPSSHVAASVVALVFAFRGWRPLGWILLTPVLGIFLAVTYLQIHYGIDAIAGLATAGVISLIAPRLCPLTPQPVDS